MMWRICVRLWMTWRLASSPQAGQRCKVARHGLEISGGGTCSEMVVGRKEGDAAQQVVTLVTGAVIHHIIFKLS